MAEDRDDSQRTEEPTQRRLDEARKKGDVVKSQDLSTFIMLSGSTLAILIGRGSAAKSFLAQFLVYLQSPESFVLDAGSANLLLGRVSYGLLMVVGPVIGFISLAAVAGHVVQSMPTISTEKIRPDLSKLSLLKGAKRLFGLDALVNLIKGILKIAAVTIAIALAIWPDRARLATSLSMDPMSLIGLLMALTLKVLLASLIVLAAIAAFDYFYQRTRFMQRHRMSRQELKDEMKQSEDDPVVKARIRQLRYERLRRRMMAAVPEATVIITNPTHYAVALKYESGKTGAPICVAKGVDGLALKIREIATEHDVPIVENPPLARALYASVELDDEISAEHYKAVAQVIGYVMRLANQRAFWRN